jgi:hypothetical protein
MLCVGLTALDNYGAVTWAFGPGWYVGAPSALDGVARQPASQKRDWFGGLRAGCVATPEVW